MFEDLAFGEKCPVLVEFFRSKKPLSIVLSDVKISTWTFLFYKKNVRKEKNIFKISKSLYFWPGGRTDINFGLSWGI